MSLTSSVSQRSTKSGISSSTRDPRGPPSPSSISPEDDQFLNDLEHANFLFFWEQANPADRVHQRPLQCPRQRHRLAASIASTGFGLTAICIGEKRGFISQRQRALRVLQTLSFLLA